MPRAQKTHPTMAIRRAKMKGEQAQQSENDRETARLEEEKRKKEEEKRKKEEQEERARRSMQRFTGI